MDHELLACNKPLHEFLTYREQRSWTPITCYSRVIGYFTNPVWEQRLWTRITCHSRVIGSSTNPAPKTVFHRSRTTRSSILTASLVKTKFTRCMLYNISPLHKPQLFLQFWFIQVILSLDLHSFNSAHEGHLASLSLQSLNTKIHE